MLVSGPLAQWHLLRKWGLGAALGVALTLLTFGGSVAARPLATDADPVLLSQLPAEAQRVHRQVREGGPFPHAKDGGVFGNRERALPPHPRGYYREYTVRAPGARDRGARRIVCGGRDATRPDSCYYTADHYNTFRKITP